MKFSKVAKLLSIFILSFASRQLFATTYIVGTCRAGHQFPTIGAALDAVSTPDTTILICPGNYPEQVWITKGVNLRGIATSDGVRVTITPPSVGLLGNDVDNDGKIIAAQIRATDATDPVNISNITVDGRGGRSPYYATGIFYRNSSGTINSVTITDNVYADPGIPSGIWIEGGVSNPSVTVENSSIDNINLFRGILSGQPGSPSPAPLSVIIRSNFFSSNLPQTGITNIYLAPCDACMNTVTGNTAFGGGVGIYMSSGKGTVTANKLINNAIGIGLAAGNFTAASNTILASTVAGVQMYAANSSMFAHNNIVNTRVGIDFNCHADGNVHSNLIENVLTGLNKVPTGISSPNIFANVYAVKSGC